MSDEDQTAAGADELERPLHRRATARRVEDKGRQLPAELVGHCAHQVCAIKGRGHTERPTRERQPIIEPVGDGHSRDPAGQALGNGQADWTGSDDERRVAAARRARSTACIPIPRVSTRRQLVETQAGPECSAEVGSNMRSRSPRPR